MGGSIYDDKQDLKPQPQIPNQSEIEAPETPKVPEPPEVNNEQTKEGEA